MDRCTSSPLKGAKLEGSIDVLDIFVFVLLWLEIYLCALRFSMSSSGEGGNE
jgi:hypothetical protein